MHIDVEMLGEVCVLTSHGYIARDGMEELLRRTSEFVDSGGRRLVLDLMGSRSGTQADAALLGEVVRKAATAGCTIHFGYLPLLYQMSADFGDYEALVFRDRDAALAAFTLNVADGVNDSTRRILLVSATQHLLQALQRDIELIHTISPEQFELLICERLDAMGHEVRRTGHTFAKDGGVDIVSWPRESPFPSLLAVQVKHKRNKKRLGPGPVRELQGVLNASPFDAGLLVTNTGFTPDAQWWASHSAHILRLRDLEDLRRWIQGNFLVGAFRDIPRTLQLGPGIEIPLL